MGTPAVVGTKDWALRDCAGAQLTNNAGSCRSLCKTATAAADPAAPHPNAPALVRGQLPGHLGRCRSRVCQSQGRSWSTAARCRSPGRRAIDSYAGSLLAGTRAPVLQARKPGDALPESGSWAARDALLPRP